MSGVLGLNTSNSKFTSISYYYLDLIILLIFLASQKFHKTVPWCSLKKTNNFGHQIKYSWKIGLMCVPMSTDKWHGTTDIASHSIQYGIPTKNETSGANRSYWEPGNVFRILIGCGGFEFGQHILLGLNKTNETLMDQVVGICNSSPYSENLNRWRL